MTGEVAPLAAPLPTADDSAVLASRLVPVAKAALVAVGSDAEARAVVLAALDAFLAAPAPSTFLTAVRVLEQACARAMLGGPGAGSIRRGFAHGLAALRAVPSLPAALVEGLAAYLPRDVRSGRRLNALAALAGAYHELGARVAADAYQRKRRWSGLPRRRPRR